MRIIWSRIKNQNSRRAEWGKTVINRAVTAACFLLTVLSQKDILNTHPFAKKSVNGKCHILTRRENFQTLSSVLAHFRGNFFLKPKLAHT